MPQEQPIFVHSLFRSGSTYVFNCFRRSSAGYWCYQEPLNEILLNAAIDPRMLLNVHEENAKHLRHPTLDRPYFLEFFPLASQIAKEFVPDLSYQDYFSDAPTTIEPLCRYLRMLAGGAQGRPMFQECRSCGRVGAIRACLGGLHIFLWRNPWDQWWSHKVDSHFEICNLQILASRSAPPLFVDLRGMVNFRSDAVGLNEIIAQRLDATGSYMLFFALWCHAMLEARPLCDFDVNIDSLAMDDRYRRDVQELLLRSSVPAIDFSDCAVPVGTYGKDDRFFFMEVEDRVLELFARHGYSTFDLERMLAMREQHGSFHHATAQNATASDPGVRFDRLRHIARRLETELSGCQRDAGIAMTNLLAAQEKTESERLQLVAAQEKTESERLQLVAALEKTESERLQLVAAVEKTESERLQLVAALEKTESEGLQLHAELGASESERKQLRHELELVEAARQHLQVELAASVSELATLRSSLYWRMGRPIRMIGKFANGLFHRK